MFLTAGARIGAYDVLSRLGEGGMGVVYRARDTKLGRDIAIKTLPEGFARDPERTSRFDREARLLASLNHPNIAAIYGFEEHQGTRFLVLELVEGETLADRLARGPIPIEDALKLALQIADALESAHERGVIHRDLKPGNIKVRPDGAIKVLDFGLAKAIISDSDGLSSSALANSPTVTNAGGLTGGLILGTAAYMAPEQARGAAVTKSIDIWAFGCVLYEMLTGHAVFEGGDVTEILAAVIRAEPDWSRLPSATPPGIRTLLRRSLRKDRHQRLQDATSLRLEIQDALTVDPVDVAPSAGVRPVRNRVVFIAAPALILGALISGLALWTLSPIREAVPVSRLLAAVAPADRISSFLAGTGAPSRPYRTAISMSPDGRYLVFAGERGGMRQLYLRAMDRLDATPIAGTENSEVPFFSPDGQWIGFYQSQGPRGELKKVPLSGGPAVALCSTTPLWGVNWGSHGKIVFANRPDGGLWQVSDAGGTPEEMTTVEAARGEIGHRLPQTLPDGKAVLFTVLKTSGDHQIVARSLVAGSQEVLLEGSSDARYVPTGHLVYVQAGALMAVPFDPVKLKLKGAPVGVLDNVMHDVNTPLMVGNSGSGQFSVSSSGTLAYLPGGASPERKASILWVDRRGDLQRLPTSPANFAFPRLSPDGKRLVQMVGSGVSIYDIDRGAQRSLLAGDRPGIGIVWSPEGGQIAYFQRGDTPGIFRFAPDTSAAAERLTTTSANQIQVPTSWSPDGKTLAFLQDDDIWVVAIGGGPATARPFLQSSARENSAEFSPDGQYLLYGSTESARAEVYLRPYPGPGPIVTISTNGGAQPAWARNGREIFYLQAAPDVINRWKLMAVDVDLGKTVKVGKPRMLFEGPYQPAPLSRMYDVANDGRFLMIQPEEIKEQPVTHIVLVQNWFEELRRRAPPK
jgi:serine/threonine-protein kinase